MLPAPTEITSILSNIPRQERSHSNYRTKGKNMVTRLASMCLAFTTLLALSAASVSNISPSDLDTLMSTNEIRILDARSQLERETRGVLTGSEIIQQGRTKTRNLG